MRPIDDPAFLTPDERLAEVASIHRNKTDIFAARSQVAMTRATSGRTCGRLSCRSSTAET